MGHFRLLLFVPVAALTVFSSVAWADPVPPPPASCPSGHDPRTDHGGPFCAPPLPSKCPPNYEPKVVRNRAYCDPPPAKPCPPGSYWTSTTPNNGYCRGGKPCGSYPCGWQGYTCRDVALCVKKVHWYRNKHYEVVASTCKKDGDCQGEFKCVKAKRCDSDQKRAAAPAGASATPSVQPSSSVTVAPTATPTPTPKPTLPASSSTSSATSAPESQGRQPPPATKPNGCAGCSLRSKYSPVAPWSSLLLFLLVLRWGAGRRSPGRSSD